MYLLRTVIPSITTLILERPIRIGNKPIVHCHIAIGHFSWHISSVLKYVVLTFLITLCMLPPICSYRILGTISLNDEGQVLLFESTSLSIVNIDIQELALGRINLQWGKSELDSTFEQNATSKTSCLRSFWTKPCQCFC